MFIVTLSDGTLSDTQTVTVTVDNENDAPTITTNGSAPTYIIVQPEARTAVITYQGTDVEAGSTLTWSISGADADAFTMNPVTGVLAFKVAPDFEAPTDVNLDNTYSVKVTLSDGALTDTQQLTVNVTNLDDLSGYFDGSTYLTATNGSIFDIQTTGDFYFEAWVKADVTSCSATNNKSCVILSKPGQYQLTLRYTTTEGLVPCFYLNRYRYYNSSNYNYETAPFSSGLRCFPSKQIRQDEWNHLKVSVKRNETKDSTPLAPIVVFWINGQAVEGYVYPTTEVIVDSPVSTGSRLTVGGVAGDSSQNFFGEIDQVRISRYAPSVPVDKDGTTYYYPQASITSMDSYQPVDSGNLIAHYDFNEETGTDVLNRAPSPAANTTLTPVQGSFSRQSVASVAISGSYTTYTFPRTYLTSQGGWKVPAGVDTASVLVVGGGGAGGTTTETGQYEGGGGGGGGGAYKFESAFRIETRTVTVWVGQGGIPQTSTRLLNASNGGYSKFGSLISTGGGAGGSRNNTSNAGRARVLLSGTNAINVSTFGGGTGVAGGSGGGAAVGSSYTSTVAGGTSGGGKGGYSGGYSLAQTSTGGRRAGGGGGGSMGSGWDGGVGSSNAVSQYYGQGGTALANAISGTNTCYSSGGGGGDQSNVSRSAGGDCYRNGVFESSANGNSGTNGPIGNSGANRTGSGGGGAGAPGSGLSYGGAGGSGIVIVQYLTQPTFGEPAAVETVTAGVVHRFAFETSSDPNVSRTFVWEYTNGVENSWSLMGNTSSYYDFKSPGSNYLETTTSGSAYSFRVKITDTSLSNGTSSSRTTSPFYVVVNPRNQITRSSYTYNETTTARNLPLTGIAAGSVPDNSWTIGSKYGDTVTAQLTFAFGTDTRTATFLQSSSNASGKIEWLNSSTNGITLRVNPTLTPGTYYETLTVTDRVNAFTRLTIRIDQAKADTITVVTQIAGQSNYTMSYGGSPAPAAIRTVTGLKNGDTLTALSTVDTRTGTSLIFQATNCASGGACSVGDLAPGGGRVFYVSSTPIAAVGGISGGGIYLATAPEVIGTRTWCNSTSIGASALSTAVGAGAFNTSILTSNCSLSSNAGRSVSEIYDINGYDDWFLPTVGDLAEIKSRLVNTGLQSISGDFWSSSTIGTTSAYGYNFGLGSYWSTSISQAVSDPKNVLPIRAFSPKIFDIYNSPTDAGSYTVTAQIEMASPGTFANYQGVQYTNPTITINRAAQDPLRMGQFSAFVGTPLPFNIFGGSGPGILVRSLVDSGTANCSYNSVTYYLSATDAGTCSVQAIRAGTPNYLTATLNQTISWTKFVAPVILNPVPTGPRAIPLAPDVVVEKKTEVVGSSSFLDQSNQPIVGAVNKGDTIRIVISGFEGLSIDDLTVYFKPYEDAQVVTITSTYVEVVVPATAITGRIAIDGPRGVTYSPSLTVNP
jgi:hypothetical protein